MTHCWKRRNSANHPTAPGAKVCCPEELAYRQGFIDAAQLERLAQPLAKSGYGKYLLDVLKEQVF